MYMGSVNLSWGIQCSGNYSSVYYNSKYRFNEIAWFSTKRTFGKLTYYYICCYNIYKVRK